MKFLCTALALVGLHASPVMAQNSLICPFLDAHGIRQSIEIEESNGLWLKVAFQLQSHAYPDVYSLEVFARDQFTTVYRCTLIEQGVAHLAVPCDTLTADVGSLTRVFRIDALGRAPYIGKINILNCR